ncbi:hypothetical protein C8Q74DRAFT_873116 [Fomes fomentarius]|nr:hypothetical protein C8Q74DRAFT_873116 [Fomes fomentarius]
MQSTATFYEDVRGYQKGTPFGGSLEEMMALVERHRGAVRSLELYSIPFFEFSDIYNRITRHALPRLDHLSLQVVYTPNHANGIATTCLIRQNFPKLRSLILDGIQLDHQSTVLPYLETLRLWSIPPYHQQLVPMADLLWQLTSLRELDVQHCLSAFDYSMRRPRFALRQLQQFTCIDSIDHIGAFLNTVEILPSTLVTIRPILGIDWAISCILGHITDCAKLAQGSSQRDVEWMTEFAPFGLVFPEPEEATAAEGFVLRYATAASVETTATGVTLRATTTAPNGQHGSLECRLALILNRDEERIHYENSALSCVASHICVRHAPLQSLFVELQLDKLDPTIWYLLFGSLPMLETLRIADRTDGDQATSKGAENIFRALTMTIKLHPVQRAEAGNYTRYLIANGRSSGVSGGALSVPRLRTVTLVDVPYSGDLLDGILSCLRIRRDEDPMRQSLPCLD